MHTSIFLAALSTLGGLAASAPAPRAASDTTVSIHIQDSPSAHALDRSKGTSEQLALVDDTGLAWESATSRLGKPYQVGRKATTGRACDDRKGSGASVLGGKHFGMGVFWKPGRNVWANTSATEETTSSISRWALSSDAGGSGGNYTLWITNTQPYDYHFYNGAGDSYDVYAKTTGDFLVKYASDDPTILFVRGW